MRIAATFIFTVFLWLFFTCLASAGLVNKTVDDELGDVVPGLMPIYTPTFEHVDRYEKRSMSWGSTSRKRWCLSKNDTGGDIPIFTFKFNGTAVYLYFVISYNVPTCMRFALDGSNKGGYCSKVVDGHGMMNNIAAISVAVALPFEEYTLSITADDWSTIYFDRVVYTTYGSGAHDVANTTLCVRKRHAVHCPGLKPVVSSSTTSSSGLLSSSTDTSEEPANTGPATLEALVVPLVSLQSALSSPSEVVGQPTRSFAPSDEGAPSISLPFITSLPAPLPTSISSSSTSASLSSSPEIKTTVPLSTSSGIITSSSASTVPTPSIVWITSSPSKITASSLTSTVPTPSIGWITSSSLDTLILPSQTMPVLPSPKSLSRRKVAIIISSAAGGTGLLILLLLYICCYRRSRRHTAQKIEPFVNKRASAVTSATAATAATASKFDEAPGYANYTDFTNPGSYGRRLLTGGSPASRAGTPTTDFLGSSELEEVYLELEALSAEMVDMRRRERPIEAGAGSSTATQSGRIQTQMAILRCEIDRLRWRSCSNSQDHASGNITPVDPLQLLDELDGLRAQLEEVLIQSGRPRERLPSYSSRTNSRARKRTEASPSPPPPLPTSPAPAHLAS